MTVFLVGYAIVVVLVLLDYLLSLSCAHDVHYVERIEGGYYITSCNRKIPVYNKNITTSISSTTCPNCLHNIDI